SSLRPSFTFRGVCCFRSSISLAVRAYSRPREDAAQATEARHRTLDQEATPLRDHRTLYPRHLPRHPARPARGFPSGLGTAATPHATRAYARARSDLHQAIFGLTAPRQLEGKRMDHHRRTRLLPFAAAMMATLLVASVASAQVSVNDRRCIEEINNSSRK